MVTLTVYVPRRSDGTLGLSVSSPLSEGARPTQVKLEGGPALVACGLAPGDVLLRVDGVSCAGLDQAAVVAALGAARAGVMLMVARGDGGPMTTGTVPVPRPLQLLPRAPLPAGWCRVDQRNAFEHYQFGDLIGQGAFGRVFSGTRIADGIPGAWWVVGGAGGNCSPLWIWRPRTSPVSYFCFLLPPPPPPSFL